MKHAGSNHRHKFFTQKPHNTNTSVVCPFKIKICVKKIYISTLFIFIMRDYTYFICTFSFTADDVVWMCQ